MNRAEAASILGVSSGATDRDVRAAFRRSVKEVHPDVSEVEGPDTVDRLRAARDVMLAPAPPGAHARRDGSGREQVRVQFPHGAPIRPPPSRRSGGSGAAAVVLAVGGAALVVAVVALLAWGAVRNDDPPRIEEVREDCLRIDGGVADAVSCDVAGALRIVSVSRGISACLPSMTRIEVDGQTYCLTEAQ